MNGTLCGDLFLGAHDVFIALLFDLGLL